MNKQLFAISLLVLMVASLCAVFPVPAVEAADNQPFFKMTIVAPGDANPARRNWGQIIANSFQSAGIDARVVFLGWGSVYDRCLTPAAENIGKTWDEGGFDALLIGWTPGSPSTPYLGSFQIYYSKNLPPNSNYFLWNNATSDRYLEQSLVLGYTDAGKAAFDNWQLVQYQDVPASQIHFTSAVFSADNALNFHDFEWIFDNIGPVPQFVTGRTEITLASTGELLSLNPPLSNSWYDTIAFNPVFDGLYYLDTDYSYKPAIAAADPVVSNNGSTYTYTLKQGVKFHDGVELTADDILFTYLAYLNPQSGSQQSATVAGYTGDDVTFKWLNGSTTRLVIDNVAGVGIYPATTETGTRQGTIEAVDTYTVRITIPDFGDLGAPAATFHPEGEPSYILPKHVLETVPFSEWQNHPFTKGTGTYTANGQTFSGPIGTGPYVYKSYDATRALVELDKFNDYYDKAALESQGLFTVQKYYVRYIEEKDGAIAALKNGEVQMLDQNYQQGRDYVAGNLNFATNYVLEGSGIQQLGYNLRHPVFGTGTATPVGQADPSKAAEAARNVRMAFEYLIPRQLIVDNLMSGLGAPAAVHVNPVSPYYNNQCVPREYSPSTASQYLAKAGYGTGAAPAGPTPSATYLVNQSIVFTGNFSIDPTIESGHGGIVALLEKQVNSTTWTPVAMGNTMSGGYYAIPYTPTQTGVQTFRVYLTGFGADDAAARGFTTPTFNYFTLPSALQVVPPDTSDPVTYNITSISSVLAPLQSQITTLNSQLSAANAQLSSTTTLMYAGWAVAIIALIAVAFVAMRKK